MNVFLIASISLDGKIARNSQHNSFSWTSQEDKNFFKEKTKEAGVVVVGRKTWETINKPLEGRLVVVMTRDPKLNKEIFLKKWPDGAAVEFTAKTPSEILKDIESRGYQSIAIAGGAEIYSLFLRENLINELFLTIHTVIFGEGIGLVAEKLDLQFDLIEIKTFGSKSCLVHACRRV